MPKKIKRLVNKLAGWGGHRIMLLIGSTLRIEKVNEKTTDELAVQGKPYILCPWHGRLFVPVYVHRNQGIVAMISQHSDGEIAARMVDKLGYGSVRGSSKSRGKEAFYELVDHLKKGGRGAMIPDGPTGPRYNFKPGTLYIAQKAGCLLIPITFAAESCWTFNSWDRFVLPKPFSRCVLYYGDPIKVPDEFSGEEVRIWCRKLEKIMIKQLEQAENHFGRAGIDEKT